MDLKKIYLDGIENIENNLFKTHSYQLNDFFQLNQKKILEILDDKIVLDKTLHLINYLISTKNYYFLLVYLQILTNKFPSNFDLLFLLVNTCLKLNMYTLAEENLIKIPKNLNSIDHLKTFANIYYNQANYDKCIKVLLQIRDKNTNDFINHAMMAECMIRTRNFNKARMELFEMKKFKDQKFENIYYEIELYIAESRFEKALEAIKVNIILYPQEPRLYNLMAFINDKQKNYKTSIECLMKAKEIGYEEYYKSLHICYFNLDDYENGFTYLTMNSVNNYLEDLFLSYQIPKWNLDNLQNKKLFIYSGLGMGIGDQIFFFRYLHDLIRNNNNLDIYFCTNNLRTKYLLSSEKINIIEINDLPSIIKDVSNSYFINLPDIAKIYFNKYNKKIIKHINFFPKNDKKFKFWKYYFSESSSQKKIGINWKGNVKYKQDLHRSMVVNELDDLISSSKFTFFIINNEVTAEEIKHLSKFENVKFIDKEYLKTEKKDAFIETIEILRNLDIIITTDTSLAHLSSALQLNTFLLLEYSSFWYWKNNSKDNFYQNKSLSYFKQDRPGDWQSALKKLKLVLNENI